MQVVRGKPCRIFSSLSKSLLLLLRKFADKNSSSLLSRPARGAWIEITGLMTGTEIAEVAPRKGRVD